MESSYFNPTNCLNHHHNLGMDIGRRTNTALSTASSGYQSMVSLHSASSGCSTRKPAPPPRLGSGLSIFPKYIDYYYSLLSAKKHLVCNNCSKFALRFRYFRGACFRYFITHDQIYTSHGFILLFEC